MSRVLGGTPRIVFCCDAGPSRGAGHVMRSIGLAEEFADRGYAPLFIASVGELGWLHDEIVRRGFALRIGDADVETVVSLAPAVTVVDAYELPPALSKTIHAAGIPVVAIVDEGVGGHQADIYVNQNLGAPTLAVDGRYLAGLPYALLRDDVLRRRPEAPATHSADRSPHVVAFFGGTDPTGAAPIVARSLVASGERFHATMVAATPALAAEIAGVVTRPAQRIEVIGPTNRLPDLVAGADLVVSASGTSLWEILCLGLPAAVVCVVDNQRIGYDQVVASGLAAGLGELDDVVAAGAGTLSRLLRDAPLRDQLSRNAWSTVDGRGRKRVADAIMLLPGLG